MTNLSLMRLSVIDTLARISDKQWPYAYPC